MRIDLRDYDTYPKEGIDKVIVFLNGRKINGVVAADEELGLCCIDSMRYNESDFTPEEKQYERDHGIPFQVNIVLRTVNGKVEIKIKDKDKK